MKTQTNLQDVFLNQVRKDKQAITIFLLSGFQIRGLVTGFDNYTVVLDCEGKQELIYKHAISTIIPTRPINFMAAEKAQEEAGE